MYQKQASHFYITHDNPCYAILATHEGEVIKVLEPQCDHVEADASMMLLLRLKLRSILRILITIFDGKNQKTFKTLVLVFGSQSLSHFAGHKHLFFFSVKFRS